MPPSRRKSSYSLCLLMTAGGSGKFRRYYRRYIFESSVNPNVGAGWLAKAVGQPKDMLNDTTPSRASPLPQGFVIHHEICAGSGPSPRSSYSSGRGPG
ncbi:hypothetical protein C0J26_27410 [Pseudomonas baetica]|nr:hypothetical protein C0J26_27410 [Pseudomonas baetica]